MRIIPVIDVMNGQAVRAVGGRRAEYRPWTGSKLTGSTDPVTVAKVMLAATGAEELYVADLDALSGVTTDASWQLALAEAFPKIVIGIDSGVRTAADLARFPDRRNLTPIIGTETVRSPDVWQPLRRHTQDFTVSIDLWNGRWMGAVEPWAEWGVSDQSTVTDLIDAAAAAGAAVLVFLDLARVGEGIGVGTEKWVRVAKGMCPHLDVFAGGGIHGRDDVKRLEDAGADGVLVATALHEGRLP